MRSSCFADLPGNTRFILVSGLVIVILTAGVLSYIYHESVPRPSTMLGRPRACSRHPAS